MAGLRQSQPDVLAPLVRRAFRAAFADQDAADQVIEASDLDRTILRATRLTPPHLSTWARTALMSATSSTSPADHLPFSFGGTHD
jgi:hypothetical protein